MHELGSQELVVLLVVAGMLLIGGKRFRELAQLVSHGIDNFRGGPGSPTHPLPANDSRLLNRRIDRSDENRRKSHDSDSLCMVEHNHPQRYLLRR
jgi:Sec-independent protein translocase protein TatA